MLDPHDIVITGDVNFHLDIVADPDARRFSEMLSDMRQLVTDATHNKGHLLDVVIVRNNTAMSPSRPSVYDPCLCDTHGNTPGDHMAIMFCVNAAKPARMRKEVVFRRLHHICLQEFKRDIVSLHDEINCAASVGDMVAAYNDGLRRLVDNHAPQRTMTITLRPDCPWYTDELRDEKQRRRRAEHKWLQTRLEVHRQAYRAQCVVFNNMLVNAKKNYYTTKIANCKNDQKQLFRITKNLMGNGGVTAMPSHVCPAVMAQRFGDHFIEKECNIRDDNVDCGEDHPDITLAAMNNDVAFGGVPVVCFETVSELDVERLVTSVPVKSCELDPIPTWLLKRCSAELVPVITVMINASVTSSHVPADFKHAIVKPLLKKPTLDKDILNNYRPVSNLPFISKLVERVVAKQLNIHIDEYALHDPFQSAYRRGHSTETALLRVKNDIAETLDKKCTTILVMLDLSAAFDSVVHELLMTRLEQSFGITDKALAWLISYISERNQKVVVGSAESGGSVVTRGVPQGSVLGPILYCIYTKPIGRIITRHGMNHHCYADDLQIYLAVDRDESIVTALAKVELCVAEVAAWLTNNNLKLNMAKSEVIIFPRRRNATACLLICI